MNEILPINQHAQPSISVVAATYNRLPLLQKLLRALSVQTLGQDSFEVIIVDDGSTDETVSYLRDFAEAHAGWCRYSLNQRQGPGAARNRGWRMASSQLIAFTDDDTVPFDNWLEELLIGFENYPDCAGLGGSIKRINDSTFSRFIDACGCLEHPRNADGEVTYLVTANAAYRRSALESVNGFREDITWPGGEDPDLSIRIRSSGRYLEKWDSAIVSHHHRDSTIGIFKTFRNYGMGSAIYESSVFPSLRSQYRLWRMLKWQLFGTVHKAGTAKDTVVFLYCGVVRALGTAWGYYSFFFKTKR
jgi:glycosyltransferase involved in cell wall biosynthesis